jgi:hypothetical protein
MPVDRLELLIKVLDANAEHLTTLEVGDAVHEWDRLIIPI